MCTTLIEMWLRALKCTVYTVVLIGCAIPLLADEPYYFVSCGPTRTIRQYDVDGTYLRDLVPNGPDAPNAPQYMAVGPDGHLYVAAWFGHDIRKYDLETGEFLGVVASGPDIVNPAYLCFHKNGELIVSSNMASRVLRIDPETGDVLGDLVEPGHFNGPHVVLFDDHGHILVSDSRGNKIVRFDAEDGSYIDDLVTDGLNQPLGMAFTYEEPKRSRILVGNWNSGIVRAYGVETGELLRTLLQDPAGRNPDGLVYHTDGSLLVCNWGSNQVRRYNGLTGEFIEVFGGDGDGMRGPNYALYVDPDQPRLWIQGACRKGGERDAVFTVTNATPGGNLALLYAGSRGRFEAPGYTVCPGMTIDLGTQGFRVIAVVKADSNGEFSMARTIPASMCSGFLQVVDLARCAASEAQQL